MIRRVQFFAVFAWFASLSPIWGDDTFYVNPATGSDANSGTKDKPFRTLPAAADRVNELKGDGAVTVILSPGTYAMDRQASFKASRKYTKADRLTIRAEVLPDDPKWDTGRMPTIVHTMPLAKMGFTFGMHVETSHVTVQGLKLLGMPGVERPRPGVLNRVYPIGRMDRRLEDLEIAQCLFAGDKVTNPNHLGILANGNGINVHHCVFHGAKLTVVYWTAGSTGHAMTNCFDRSLDFNRSAEPGGVALQRRQRDHLLQNRRPGR